MPRLLAGESMVLLPQRRHWIVPVRGWLVGIGAAGLFLLIASRVPVHVSVPGSAPSDLQSIQLLTVATVVAMWAYWVWLRWRCCQVIVTDQRLIIEEGVVLRSVTQIPFRLIRDTASMSGIGGQLLGYGAVRIVSSGDPRRLTLNHMSYPDMLRDQVFVLIEHTHRFP